MRIKKTYLYLGIALLLIVFISTIIYLSISSISGNGKSSKWSIDKNSRLVYQSNRGKPVYELNDFEQADSLIVQRINYQSRDAKISGYLVTPKMKSEKSGKLPAVILLPGAGVTKESEITLAKEISKMGFVVLTIDARSTGESSGIMYSVKQDYSNYAQGIEPAMHKNIYDALVAFDILSEIPSVDRKSIIIAGESMGGRTAIIAAGIEKRIKGVIGICTSGYNFGNIPDESQRKFLNSIDPDNYLPSIPPRKLFLIHNQNDKTIPPQFAQITFQKAIEPKKFYMINDSECNHGYCESMKEDLKRALESIIGKDKD